MAMSRSFGATELTSVPSMRISPSLTLSRPAIMASSVDLPQPDGPTRAMNSPVCSLEIDSLEDLDRAEALGEPRDGQRRHGRARHLMAPWVSPRTKYLPPKR